jgi:hypothetical protein
VQGIADQRSGRHHRTDALAERRRVVRVDSAGAGRSPLSDDISIVGPAVTWPPSWTP